MAKRAWAIGGASAALQNKINGNSGNGLTIQTSRDNAVGPSGIRMHPASQQRQFRTQFVEHRRETAHGSGISCTHRYRLALRADHEIDRPVVEVQASARQDRDLHARVGMRAHIFTGCALGHGRAPLSATRSRLSRKTSSSGRTWSRWPPSAA